MRSSYTGKPSSSVLPFQKRSRILSFVSQPNARTNTVAGNLRLRSIRTATTSLASVSSSIHAPRLGITVESYKRLPIVSISLL